MSKYVWVKGSGLTSIMIVSKFPSWFPGAYYAGYARKARATIERSVDYPFDIVRKQMSEGTASPSFVASYLNDLGSLEDEEDYLKDLKGAAAQIYTAGADTVSIHYCALVL